MLENSVMSPLLAHHLHSFGKVNYLNIWLHLATCNSYIMPHFGFHIHFSSIFLFSRRPCNSSLYEHEFLCLHHLWISPKYLFGLQKSKQRTLCSNNEPRGVSPDTALGNKKWMMLTLMAPPKAWTQPTATSRVCSADTDQKVVDYLPRWSLAVVDTVVCCICFVWLLNIVDNMRVLRNCWRHICTVIGGCSCCCTSFSLVSSAETQM